MHFYFYKLSTWYQILDSNNFHNAFQSERTLFDDDIDNSHKEDEGDSQIIRPQQTYDL